MTLTHPRSTGFIALAGVVFLMACETPTQAPHVEAQFGLSGRSGPSFNAGGTSGGVTGTAHAQELPNGNVVGSVEFKNRFFDPPFQGSGVVDCLVIVGGNSAIYGGVLTDVKSAPDFFPDFTGTRFWNQVWDNGEGAGSPPDARSGFFLGLPDGFGCPDLGAEPQNFTENGQVQVHPG